MLCADYAAYIQAQDKVSATYKVRDIPQYIEEIWLTVKSLFNSSCNYICNI